MPTSPIVEAFDKLEERAAVHVMSPERPLLQQFALQGRSETLGRGAIVNERESEAERQAEGERRGQLSALALHDKEPDCRSKRNGEADHLSGQRQYLGVLALTGIASRPLGIVGTKPSVQPAGVCHHPRFSGLKSHATAIIRSARPLSLPSHSIA